MPHPPVSPGGARPAGGVRARALASLHSASFDSARAATASVSRRRFLAGLGALAGAAAIGPRSLVHAASRETPAWTKGRVQALAGSAPRHLVWVWQFEHDGDPVVIRDTLAAYGLGVVLKTHDGHDWMSAYDDSPFAISGASSVADWARFFEDGGVPFHAWTLVKGIQPETEAQMAADVLSAGARSLFIDLEAHDGFWEGTETAAGIFGERLRTWQPNAVVSTSIDPRPWEIDRIPLDLFAEFSDEISPQAYWGFFDNDANAKKYKAAGSSIPDSGISAAFVVQTMMERLVEFNRPIHPIGDGTATDIAGWQEFINHSYADAGATTVSLWRYGIATDEILSLLANTPPNITTYTVQPGDTLGTIAGRFGTSVGDIIQTNGIANPNLITVGQTLVLPSGASGNQPIANPSSGTPPAATGGASGGEVRSFPPPPSWAQTTPIGGGTYEVKAGDSLFGIAIEHGVSLDAMMSANGITDANFIRVGQRLTIP